MSTAFIKGPNGFTLLLDGQNHTVSSDNPNYEKLLDAIKAKDWEQVDKLLNVADSANEWLSTEPGFKLESGIVTLDEDPFPDAVSEKVLAMMREGFDANPLLRFLRKVRENPSYAAQNELLLFCVANGFAIAEDGDVIAYKAVNEAYKDMHSGTFDNSVGQIVQMPRHKVDDRRDETCSHGLHFAAFEYAQNFGGAHLMIIKVNPRDVVSIPSDYGNQKGRCCRYEVIGESVNRKPLPKREVYSVSNIWADVEDDDDDAEDDETCSNCGRDCGFLDASYCPGCGHAL